MADLDDKARAYKPLSSLPEMDPATAAQIAAESPRYEVNGSAGYKAPEPQAPLKTEPAPTQIPDQTDWLQRLMKGYTDPMAGPAQMFAKAMIGIGWKPEFHKQFLDNIQKEENQYQAARGDNAGTFDGIRTLGNFVNPGNVVATAAMPGAAAGTAARLAGSAAAGGISGLMQPVYGEGDFWSEKAKQTGLGAGVGAIIPAVTGTVARVVSPKASVNPDLKLLKSEGVNPTIGQTLGGAWNKAEEQAMSIPIVGNMIARARGNALQDFNNAAINRATAPIGVRVEGAGHSAIGKASESLSNAYENSLNSIGNTTLGDSFTAISNAAKQEVGTLPSLYQSRFNKLFDSPGKRLVSENGEISAKDAKAVMSDVGKEIRKFSNSSDVSTVHYVEQLTKVQDALRGVISGQNPTYAQALKSADTGWANLVRVENAANRAVNSEGIFTPSQLNFAARSGDSTVRRNATAHGDALMQDLASAGQNVLGNKVPDSGTAGRGILAWLLSGGAGYVNPVATIGGLLGGSTLYTSPAQKVLTGAVSSRPAQAPIVADYIRYLGNPLIPAFSPAFTQIPNK